MLISGIEIEIIKKKMKHMHLYVLPPEGTVRITAPNRTTDETIRRFALSRMAWIQKHVKKYEHYEQPVEQCYATGEQHALWGEWLHLEVRSCSTAGYVFLENGKLILNARAESTGAQREKILHDWYRSVLLAAAEPLVQTWETKMHVKAKELRIKNMKTRWGTCSIAKKRIWLNLQLVKKPKGCLQYVVVHELAHLLEKRHNANFYAHMASFLPDWRSWKKTLNQSDGIGHSE